ncbi:MAG: hypothetical protein NTW25_15935 [Candidatus Kapabacteria bacterium]|nr:hypothetical protein [Candidatus Kapabacteria bacterium]
MQTLRIQMSIGNNGIVSIPLEYLQFLPKEKQFTAIIELPNTENNENKEWKEMTEKAFIDSYSVSDEIYDSI